MSNDVAQGIVKTKAKNIAFAAHLVGKTIAGRIAREYTDNASRYEKIARLEPIVSLTGYNSASINYYIPNSNRQKSVLYLGYQDNTNAHARRWLPGKIEKDDYLLNVFMASENAGSRVVYWALKTLSVIGLTYYRQNLNAAYTMENASLRTMKDLALDSQLQFNPLVEDLKAWIDFHNEWKHIQPNIARHGFSEAEIAKVFNAYRENEFNADELLQEIAIQTNTTSQDYVFDVKP